MEECSKCENRNNTCPSQVLLTCLKNSECGCGSYDYPYGPSESRHCVNCGAEWPVWK